MTAASPLRAVTQAHTGAGVTYIELGDGHRATVDTASLPLIAGYRWRCLHTPTGRQYAVTQVRRRTIYMHRLVAQTPADLTTDHANGDGLDNRRSNLRPATSTQNNANVAKKQSYAGRPPTSQYKGVCWDREKGRWHARISVEGKQTFLGRYDSETEAARAYDVAAHATWGEFAVLNFPEIAHLPSPYRPGRRPPAPKTHCPQNHPYDDANTAINKHGYKVCRACRAVSDRRRRAAGQASKQRSAA